jgi:hypothetical protein
MKQTLTTSQVADLLLRDDNAKWSYEAARALAEYYESQEENDGEELEFDAVAIRCEWDEYATAGDIAKAYRIADLDGLTDDEIDEAVEREIEHKSELIKLPKGKGYLVRAF